MVGCCGVFEACAVEGCGWVIVCVEVGGFWVALFWRGGGSGSGSCGLGLVGWVWCF